MCRLLLVLMSVQLMVATPVRAADPGFAFGGSEIQRNRFSIFPKWATMLARQALEKEPASGGLPRTPASGECIPNPRFACVNSRAAYQSFLASVQALPRDDQLKSVNLYLNAAPYITDIVNWGVSDYWETWLEFVFRSGDCEDYAIAKYMTLKALGWPPADMRVVIVQDENLNVAHAVLAVKRGSKTFILDNQVEATLPDTAIRHYRPFYSVNDSGFWISAGQ
jgi:predicted transglutaminase-like cysteine proteinase